MDRRRALAAGPTAIPMPLSCISNTVAHCTCLNVGLAVARCFDGALGLLVQSGRIFRWEISDKHHERIELHKNVQPREQRGRNKRCVQGTAAFTLSKQSDDEFDTPHLYLAKEG